MASILDPLRRVPLVGDTIDEVSGRKGLNEAAQGARDAQEQARALAELQWQRQMQGLQEARGQTQPYLSLYDRIYGTQMAGNVTRVPGLSPPGQATSGPAPSGQAAPWPTGPNEQSAVSPDGTRHPFTGGGMQAPVMRGRPPAPGYVPPPVSPAPTSNAQPPRALQTQPPGLQDLLRRLRGGAV